MENRRWVIIVLVKNDTSAGRYFLVTLYQNSHRSNEEKSNRIRSNEIQKIENRERD